MPSAPTPTLGEVQARHPKFLAAVLADARTNAAYRGERFKFTGQLDGIVQALRLIAVSDAFIGQVCYRGKARLQALGIPVLPRLLHRMAIAFAQVAIGDPVVIQPGLYLPHGQVVIDGFVEIGANTRIMPFVTIGLRHGEFKGPNIGSGVAVGTGAKVLGAISVGKNAEIGANAVVVQDVPAGSVAVGVPARVRAKAPKEPADPTEPKVPSPE